MVGDIKEAGNVEKLPVLKLENGKTIYIDGHSITHDEAMEAARVLIKTLGNDFERKVLRDC